MAIKAQFDLATDNIEFTTKTNGDRVDIRNVHLGQEEAQNLAYLINGGKTLTIIIKEKAVP